MSLIGRDPPNPNSNPEQQSGSGTGQSRVWLADVAREVEAEIGGRVLTDEEVAQKKAEAGSSPRDPAVMVVRMEDNKKAGL